MLRDSYHGMFWEFTHSDMMSDFAGNLFRAGHHPSPYPFRVHWWVSNCFYHPYAPFLHITITTCIALYPDDPESMYELWTFLYDTAFVHSPFSSFLFHLRQSLGYAQTIKLVYLFLEYIFQFGSVPKSMLCHDLRGFLSLCHRPARPPSNLLHIYQVSFFPLVRRTRKWIALLSIVTQYSSSSPGSVRKSEYPSRSGFSEPSHHPPTFPSLPWIPKGR
jgi:hypothetical protein